MISFHVKLFAFRVAVVPGLDVALAPDPQALVGLPLRQLLLLDVVGDDHVTWKKIFNNLISKSFNSD